MLGPESRPDASDVTSCASNEAHSVHTLLHSAAILCCCAVLCCAVLSYAAVLCCAVLSYAAVLCCAAEGMR
jgi:hypothetical protein